jgi:hypothetical protein
VVAVVVVRAVARAVTVMGGGGSVLLAVGVAGAVTVARAVAVVSSRWRWL